MIFIWLRHCVNTAVLLVVLVLVGCSANPIDSATYLGSELRLLPKMTLTRQQTVTLSANNHIGLQFSGVDAKAPALLRVKPKLQQSAANQFAQSFSNVTVLPSQGIAKADYVLSSAAKWRYSSQNDVDFLVRISLLEADDRFKDKQTRQDAALNQAVSISADEGIDDETPSEESVVIIPQPYTATVKMQLIDARTRRIIDTGLLEGRSGAFAHTSYDDFLDRLFETYTHALTARQTHRYY